jgi:hypothetical protein
MEHEGLTYELWFPLKWSIKAGLVSYASPDIEHEGLFCEMCFTLKWGTKA